VRIELEFQCDLCGAKMDLNEVYVLEETRRDGHRVRLMCEECNKIGQRILEHSFRGMKAILN